MSVRTKPTPYMDFETVVQLSTQTQLAHILTAAPTKERVCVCVCVCVLRYVRRLGALVAPQFRPVLEQTVLRVCARRLHHCSILSVVR